MLLIDGSLLDGPWAYRVCWLVIIYPLAGTLLVVFGTLVGRHAYFRHMSIKIYSYFGIPPHLVDETFYRADRAFQMW